MKTQLEATTRSADARVPPKTPHRPPEMENRLIESIWTMGALPIESARTHMTIENGAPILSKLAFS